jgi:hypothetical protein
MVKEFTKELKLGMKDQLDVYVKPDKRYEYIVLRQPKECRLK